MALLYRGSVLEQPLIRSTIAGRAVIDRETIHIHDLSTESETEFAESMDLRPAGGPLDHARDAVTKGGRSHRVYLNSST